MVRGRKTVRVPCMKEPRSGVNNMGPNGKKISVPLKRRAAKCLPPRPPIPARPVRPPVIVRPPIPARPVILGGVDAKLDIGDVDRKMRGRRATPRPCMTGKRGGVYYISPKTGKKVRVPPKRQAKVCAVIGGKRPKR
jgi:hypothetical protein